MTNLSINWYYNIGTHNSIEWQCIGIEKLCCIDINECDNNNYTIYVEMYRLTHVIIILDFTKVVIKYKQLHCKIGWIPLTLEYLYKLFETAFEKESI